jgi:O-antigen/teichoic acid export membrane protein
VNLVCFPAALHLWYHEAGRLDRFLEESLRLVAVLLGLFVTCACVLARWGVTLLAGPAYLSAAGVLPLLVVGYSAATLIQLLRFVPMVVERRTGRIAVCYLAIAAIDIVLSLVLIPRHAMTGAALAGLVAQAAGLVLVGAVARRSLPALRWWQPLARPLAATAIAAPAALFVSVPPGASLREMLAAATACAAAYVALSHLAGALDSGDWKRLRGLLAPSASLLA